MKIENKNIEDFFKDSLENFQVNPSDNLWEKITHDLESQDNSVLPIQDHEYEGLRKVFENYVVEPSSNIWNNILKSMDTRRSFIGNIFYLIRKELAFANNRKVYNFIVSCVLLLGLSLIPDYSNHINSPKNIVLSKNDKPDKLTENKTSTQLGIITQSPVSKEDNSLQKNGSKTSSVIITEKQAIASNNNYKSENGSRQISILNNNPSGKNTIIIKTSKEEIVQGTKTTTSTKNTNNNEGVIAKNNSNNESLILKPQEENMQVSSENYNLTIIKPVKFKLNSTLPFHPINKATTLNIDMSKMMDEVLDSAYLKWTKFFSQNTYKWYVELFDMPYYTTTQVLKLQNLVSQPQTQITEKLNAQPGTRLGINIGYNVGKFIFETGISYENIESYQTYNLTWRKTDTITLNHNDSIGVIFNVIDNTYKTLYRLRWDTTYCASEISKNYAAKVTYQIIEVPIMIGYQFFNENSSLNIKTGVKADFIISTTQVISTIDENVSSYITLPQKTSVNWLWVLSVNYNYGLSDHLSLSITPLLSYFLNSFYKDYPIVLHPASVGIGVGIKYRF